LPGRQEAQAVLLPSKASDPLRPHLPPVLAAAASFVVELAVVGGLDSTWRER
jgi:hypothetical protein